MTAPGRSLSMSSACASSNASYTRCCDGDGSTKNVRASNALRDGGGPPHADVEGQRSA